MSLSGAIRCEAPARVNHGPGVRQLLEQSPGAAGMVEVHVGDEQILDGLPRDAEPLQRRQQVRHRVNRAGVDDRRATGTLDDVHRRKAGPEVFGVDGGYAVGMTSKGGFSWEDVH